MNTGIIRPGFPSAGAWVTYGLGSKNQNPPGFAVLAGGVLNQFKPEDPFHRAVDGGKIGTSKNVRAAIPLSPFSRVF
jgi:hypothetical protein